MPARTFTRKTIKWKPCAYCGDDFPDSRKNRKYCDDDCKKSARRLREREGVIADQGNRCKTCPKKYNPQYPTPFYVTNGAALCGKCFVGRSQDTFWKRWPKGQKGYVAQKRGRST